MRARLALAVVAALAVGGIAAADPGPPPPPANVSELDRKLAQIEQDEKAIRGELESLAPKNDDARRRVVARGRILYRLVRAGLLPVGGGFDALVVHAMKVERTRRGLEDDMTELRRVSDRRVALTRRLEELALRRGPLELEHQAQTRARAALDEAEDRRLAFERAFQSSTGASDYVAVYGGGMGPGDPAVSAAEGFHALRGRLPFPIAGRAEIRTVKRDGAAGRGLEMHAPIGTPVRAVYSGRVAFADRYGSFGQLVILDHGERYFTVMGNLGGIDVRVGDDVPAGARVGSVGNDGSGAMLYFEVRHGAQTLDPGPWLGL